MERKAGAGMSHAVRKWPLLTTLERVLQSVAWRFRRKEGVAMPSHAITKGPILRKLEAALNNASRETRVEMLRELLSPDTSLWDLAGPGGKYELGLDDDEQDHVQKWWKVKDDMEVVRRGLVVALKRSLDPVDGNPGRTTLLKCLHVACYAIQDLGENARGAASGHHTAGGAQGEAPMGANEHPAGGETVDNNQVEVSVSWTSKQVTMIIHSIYPPYDKRLTAAEEEIWVIEGEKAVRVKG